jgi:CheY-like chemotaxis protein
VVNDDLGAFVGLAAMLGRAARRTIEADVYAALASNSGAGPTLLDGNPLFHSSRNNITTAAALSVEAIELDRVAMASQRDVGGNDFLDLRPQVLLTDLNMPGVDGFALLKTLRSNPVFAHMVMVAVTATI